MVAAWDWGFIDDPDDFYTKLDGEKSPWENIIRRKARRILFDVWNRKNEICPHAASYDDLFPISIKMIIEDYLRLIFDEPDDIPLFFSERKHGQQRVVIAGLVDRKNRKITIARNFSADCRRFTGAHEIGHWILHPNLLYLRERPMSGNEFGGKRRPKVEEDADFFAAELLMPTKYLVHKFFEIFGGPIDGTKPNEGLAFWLSCSSKNEIDPSEFASWPKRERSKLIARASVLGGRHFKPLVKHFGVSLTAMARQLEDCYLVR